jgi:hypothetical protein
MLPLIAKLDQICARPVVGHYLKHAMSSRTVRQFPEKKGLLHKFNTSVLFSLVYYMGCIFSENLLILSPRS